jgi:hypothetical protein
MTYFRTGTPYYHRRTAVSRSCSGWEGVGPAGYGRQALRGRAAGVLAVGACLWCRSLVVNARERIGLEGKVG